MEKTEKISQYRKRLDKTLASPDLMNKETLKTLVKNHLLRSSLDKTEECCESAIEKKTKDLSNFLDMLRSASLSDNGVPKTCETADTEWKLKQDNEEFRIMYREGPPGTRYHSLLVEGYIDGPIDVCLCVSWESTLYKKWWPQSIVPAFKIVSSKCLQKVRIGEQISVMRMKVPWPLLPREVVVQYFEFEYFQEDLIVVLINSVSDLENIDRSIQGTNEGIPETKDVVRVDMLGGFAYQKVTPERTYFRQIGNVDLKMDFVPPSLINFMARQIIGNGFRLYEKTVASAYNRDKDFSNVLGDPLYARIHKALYSTDKPNGELEQKEIKSDAHTFDEVHSINSMTDDMRDMDQIHKDDQASEHSPRIMLVANTTCKKAFGKIKEEDGEDIKPLDEGCESKYQHLTNKDTERCNVNGEENTFISREVEQALGTLEKVIYMVREHGFSAKSGYTSGFTNKQAPTVENGLAKDPTPLDNMECSNGEVCAEVSNVKIMDKSSDESSNGYGVHDLRPAGSNHYSTKENHNGTILQEPKISSPNQIHHIDMCSNTNGKAEAPILDKTEIDTKHMALRDNNIKVKGNKQKTNRLCCIKFNFGHVIA